MLDWYRAWSEVNADLSSSNCDRSIALWSAVEQRKARETDQWRKACETAAPDALSAKDPYDALMHLIDARLATDPTLAAAEREIEKDIKRTFPLLAGYASREVATRNVLLGLACRNPRVSMQCTAGYAPALNSASNSLLSLQVGYCQSLNFVAGALLMSDLSEQVVDMGLALSYSSRLRSARRTPFSRFAPWLRTSCPLTTTHKSSTFLGAHMC
eukprot:5524414-Prymnesium_polylepis.1